MTDILDPQVAPDPATTKWVPLGGGAGTTIPPVQNGKWIKGVGGAAVWASIAAADIGGGYAPNKISVGTMAAGPPASPATNDIWIATDVDASGTCWQFRYDGASASAYKWQCIGGADALVYIGAAETQTSLSAWLDLATVGPSFTVARAGDYNVIFGVQAFCSAANMIALSGVCFGAAAPTGDFAASTVPVSSNVAQDMTHSARLAGAPAGTEFRVRYNSQTPGTTTYRYRWLRVQPVRVS